MDTPRRRSFIEKLIHRHESQSAAHGPDHDTHSTTGLIQPDHTTSDTSATRTLTLPLTGGGTETLVVPDDQIPRDPANADPERWQYRGGRKASIPASDTGEKAVHASDVEKAQYVSLLQQTKGMDKDQIREFLKNRGVVDGGKVMRRWEEGKTGDGFMQLTGADSGAM